MLAVGPVELKMAKRYNIDIHFAPLPAVYCCHPKDMLLESKPSGLLYTRNSIEYRSQSVRVARHTSVAVPAYSAYAPEVPTDLPPPSYNEIIASFARERERDLPPPPTDKDVSASFSSSPLPSPGPKDVAASGPSRRAAALPVVRVHEVPEEEEEDTRSVLDLSPNGIAEPVGFGRMPSPAFSYEPFETVWLYAKEKTLEHGWPLTAPKSLAARQTAHPFSTHDVRETDWRRFLGDLEFGARGAWVPMPETSKGKGWQLFGSKPTKERERLLKQEQERLVMQIILTWNHLLIHQRFFGLRRMEVYLFKGSERLKPGSAHLSSTAAASSHSQVHLDSPSSTSASPGELAPPAPVLRHRASSFASSSSSSDSDSDDSSDSDSDSDDDRSIASSSASTHPTNNGNNSNSASKKAARKEQRECARAAKHERRMEQRARKEERRRHKRERRHAREQKRAERREAGRAFKDGYSLVIVALKGSV
ncbi:hypothetical protein PUNSTDRAFT_44496 [Punctularia strigosozonata HHB-11173 SS5]|uniref:uncharacterized protein n=1 Tax=Punctularia strigosozonata (strain HHB-11173) TaxID=741275 RepID=UPI0004416304|nr:uncharacterized protein PUNSTDRAFT_44496 [Punctularia strigosozonata HHB-11173 SS5]EIN09027.1 hypothetical protein PUNSTDRAFT_44496 [Punctularia strigosozonata HHB-11173 SS5]